MKNSEVITRFAPSPTGYLHIGGARTALFNWLFAKKHGGKFYLRIEDTDRERSTQAATDAIIEGMNWLGLNHDGDIIYQFARSDRHRQVAMELLNADHAYYCYTSQEELAAFRAKGKSYDRKWRDSNEKPPSSVNPVIRLKSPLVGEITVKDHIRGDIKVDAKQLEDLVILRSDGSPTYNLAVVVDDYDMGITHIIRGEDHITNAAKQVLIYQLMGWQAPEFAHVPLIHGADGAKLSKRHGALGVDEYQKMGYLPEALNNYLLRLGWSHNDDEIISQAQAIEWFNLDSIGKSPSRFDFTKLDNLNGHYIRECDNQKLIDLIDGKQHEARLLAGMNGLKQRAKTILELKKSAQIYTCDKVVLNDKAKEALNEAGKKIITDLLVEFENLPKSNKEYWNEEAIQNIAKEYAVATGLKLGVVAQPIRAALTGSNISPSVFEIMWVLGRKETIKRLQDAIQYITA
jgi:glutamyl-tRNA synthetase